MTKFYYVELPEEIERRVDVLGSGDIDVYINTKRRRAKDEGSEAAIRIVEG